MIIVGWGAGGATEVVELEGKRDVLRIVNGPMENDGPYVLT
jgi:hypothetical protein